MDVGKKKWACVKLGLSPEGRIEKVESEPLPFLPPPVLPKDCRVVVADVPIGLLEDSKGTINMKGNTSGSRSVDKGARKWCRQTGSVSAPPTRGQFLTGLDEHSRAAQATTKSERRRRLETVKPKGLTFQALEMLPAIESGAKIKCLYPDRFYESHPEIVFAAIAGGIIPMGKKSLSGVMARAMYLSKRLGIDCVRWVIDQEGKTKINVDDWLDALAMAVVAYDWRVLAGRKMLSAVDGKPKAWSGERDFLMALPTTDLKEPPQGIPLKQATSIVLAGLKQMEHY
jgi:predicted RNase H-like nuclease